MPNWLANFFGCAHSKYSFPRTLRKGMRRGQAAAITGTYVVCLDCGSELPYDWEQMCVLSPRAAGKYRAQLQAADPTAAQWATK